MKHILVFGTGVSAEKVFVNIKKENVSIKAFLDNSDKKQGSMFYGYPVIKPEDCRKMDFDYIIIASVRYTPIIEQLENIGVDREKIFAYFAFCHKEYDKFREIIHMEGMMYDELNLKLEKIKKYTDNMQYEVAGKLKKNTMEIPIVKSIDETIDVIIEKKLSISRYGDGEFEQIDGHSIGFQKADLRLSEKLKEVLTNPIDGHIVALADVYGDLSELEDKYADFFREFLIKYRMDNYKYLDMHRVYYNAFISRLYSEMKDKSGAGRLFDKCKKIWEERDVVIVEGEKTRFGVGNDLLYNSKSVRRILVPNEDAFSVYDKILNCCKKMEKEVCFLLAIGPTATVLAYDLAKCGYQAIDIGHFDIEYEWYIRKIKDNKVIIEGKYTNEVVGGNIVSDINDDEYIDEIVAQIKEGK